MEKALENYKNAEKKLASSVADNRLKLLFDGGKYTEFDRFTKNGENGCGVVTAFGYINGMGVYAFSQDHTVLGGAMGKVQANKILSLYQKAAQNGSPIIGMFDSKGALFNEGLDALDAYGELIKAAGNISGVVPQVSVVMGSCIGSAAILAAQADITVMLEGAELCLNSKFVTGNQEVGTAKVCMENGLASNIAETEEDAINKVREIFTFLPENNLSVPLVCDYVPNEVTECPLTKLIDKESFVELYGEYGKCAHVGFARVGGKAIGLVVTDARVNDGRLCSNGAKKIARFVRLCDAFSLPIVTLLNCNGFMGSDTEELDGDVKTVAMLTHAYSEATTAKITVVVGNAYGSVYTAFAGKAAGVDFTLAWNISNIAAFEPKTGVQILLNEKLGEASREELENEYKLTIASPLSAAANGFISDVIEPEDTAQKVIELLDILASKRVSTLDKKHSLIQL